MRPTEASNPLTTRIDQGDTADLVAVLAEADRELFGSSQWGPGLSCPEFQVRLASLGREIERVLEHPRGQVVMAGAGTSGRLALQLAATFPNERTSGRIIGLLAGGVDAFFKAKEGVEDLPEQGAKMLRPYLNDGPLVYIGISCGLSAAYVAGQMALALKHPGAHVAVIGFNSLEQANNRRLVGLGLSFRELLQNAAQNPRFTLLNPSIGAEPITGSTRMKGGSATKLIIDLLLARVKPTDVMEQLLDIQQILYRSWSAMPDWIDRAAQSLRDGGGFTYLAGPRSGLLALLDASECPPTFGSLAFQVETYVPDSLLTFLPTFPIEAHQYHRFDPSHHPPRALFSVLLPGESAIDLNELAAHKPGQCRIPAAVLKEVARLPAALRSSVLDWCLKLTLNTLSTGAFVRAGKVFGNLMIDLSVSNLKLWDRAIRVIAEVGRTDTQTAEHLLRLQLDDPEDHLLPEELIAKAVRSRFLVPSCILQARLGLSLDQAQQLLKKDPRLSTHLALVQ